jgi:hypothetical protein
MYQLRLLLSTYLKHRPKCLPTRLLVTLLRTLEVLQHRIPLEELCHLIPQVVLQPLTNMAPLRLLTYLVEVHLYYLVVI